MVNFKERLLGLSFLISKELFILKNKPLLSIAVAL